MLNPFPQPQVGKEGDVVLGGLPITVVPGSWKVEEPQRFGEKLSIGPLKYADFNPFESAQSFSNLSGGYGLRCYSDLDSAEKAQTMYRESSNVDCRFGHAILSAKQTVETFNIAPTTPPLWIGEFTPSAPHPLAGQRQLVMVTQREIYTRDAVGLWTKAALTFAQDAVAEAIGVFGSYLIIGFGAAAVGICTTDLATSTPTRLSGGAGNVYVWAFTSDRSSAYIAGGLTPADSYKVYPSLDGREYAAASVVVCGSSDSAITELAPGGGVAILFVGKTTELAEIDNEGVYRVLVPFDTRLDANCKRMRWWLGASGDEQRGPVILVFPRDRSVWAYEPSSESVGKAENIAPWAQPNLRPPTVRGPITALHGTARWLYFVVTSDGHSWVVARDARTGASHPFLDLGASANCQVLGLSSLFGGNPLLFAGVGNGVVSMILPLDGELPLDDEVYQYASEGTLDLPDIDLGFPDEDKVVLGIRIVGDNLVAGSRYIRVYASYDGEDYIPIGIAESNSTEIVFDPDSDVTVMKRLRLRLKFYTQVPLQTPQLQGISVRMSLNTKIYRQWSFLGAVPGGASPLRTQLIENPQRKIADLWTARRAGAAIPFVDRWNDVYHVRILKLGEREVFRDTDRVAETQLEIVLLEASIGQDVVIDYFAPVGDTPFFPLSFPWTPFYSSVLSTTQTIANDEETNSYPCWTITGPGRSPTFTNITTGETFSLDYTLSAGEVVTINFAPTRKYAVSDSIGDVLDRIVAGSIFWALEPGDNQIRVELGGTSAGSQVALARDVQVTYY